MEITDMIKNFANKRDNQVRGIFASIFILQNRLQTVFDKADEYLTLKQFMLLTMIRYSHDEKTTFTHLGNLLGSSRQNAKKLALSLEKKGFIRITHEPNNKRNTLITMTAKADEYLEIVLEMHNQKLASIFNDYTDEEIKLFYGMITKLYAGVEREEQTEDE
ncbi:MarR family winged helix-turn-helix transcriptional regulator [Listeria seeligeri]|uniref:MarR family winged helix-turn-helix transcriptional regulator n=1 Tax=Listeria seeligeri TaxID=1640 RepID=UPI0010E67856|nr:MarR family transcriptional regulator [Listeria seeligeri]MBC1422744.1 MarR family transcriptional regulator [Listeria seeligeri]MBC1430233.1 MarR family transcriptional regulator [Listeria seeligeri]MBC1481238.1 MarR family transcriptional regulator [Listeria seeligeri]MBC1527985.1 MarR family transcriptional regulator [Listeria seeligeri]MBC1533939.1 MarR family transcriptional regulator [Listeria seeligeri]